ncbi:NRDE-2, necessary for RNA interference domain-containing protein [Ditylenchus destructor]|nr:NRDE-2, necessary for RNA interference domain-containing protein [Ditylenchus destructor]
MTGRRDYCDRDRRNRYGQDRYSQNGRDRNNRNRGDCYGRNGQDRYDQHRQDRYDQNRQDRDRGGYDGQESHDGYDQNRQYSNGSDQRTYLKMLKTSHENRTTEEKLRKTQEENRQLKKLLQENSEYSYKKLGADSGDEMEDGMVEILNADYADPFDDQPSSSGHSALRESHSPRRRDEDPHQERELRMTQERNLRQEDRKRKDRSDSRNSNPGSSSRAEKDHSPKRQKTNVSLPTFTRNDVSNIGDPKYRLLRKNEWSNTDNVCHWFVDSEGSDDSLSKDNEGGYNITPGQSYKILLPRQDSSPIIFMPSRPFWHMGLLGEGTGTVTTPTTIQRYYHPDTNHRHNRPVERRFRDIKMPQPNVLLSRPIPISSVPCGAEEKAQGGQKMEEEIVLAMGMTSDAYGAVVESRKVSMEEAIESKRFDQMSQIFFARCQMNPNDVESWIKYVDIQNKLMAKKESNDADNAVTNTKGLYREKVAILEKAIEYNPRNVELAFKRVEIDREYFGVNSTKVLTALNTVANSFATNLEMWSKYIQMKQNDRSLFTLQDTISLIDKCIRSLVDIRDGSKNKWSRAKVEPGTDKFLVDLIVHQTGHVSWAVASLQAFTEFQFFAAPLTQEMKPKDFIPEKLDMFREFWESGVPRIGDNFASGWNSENNDMHFSKEREQLLAQIARVNRGEDKIQLDHQNLAVPELDVWRRVDILRSEELWRPVRCGQHNDNLIQDRSRVIKFEQISAILFHLSDRKLACDLVYRLLHLFGAIIPGMEILDQEGILRSFSSDFPNFSLEYKDLRPFMDKFFDLLSKADGIDSIRAKTAKLITGLKLGLIADESLSLKKKVVAIRRLINEYIKDSTMPENEKMVQIYFMLKQVELIDGKSFLKWTYRFLHVNKTNYWEIENRIERIVYLSMAQDVCRRLPFDGSELKTENGAEFDGITKKKFLMSLGIFSYVVDDVTQIEITDETVKKAKETWIERLKMRDPCVKVAAQESVSENSELSWLGNEAEITLELGALFVYETTPDNDAKKTFDFVLSEKGSNLARRLREKPFVYALRVDVYEREIQRCQRFGRQELFKVLEDAVRRFPEKVEFVKKYLEIQRNTFEKRLFLRKLPGNSGKAKLVRSAARIFYEWECYRRNPKNENGLTSLRQVLDDAARDQVSNGHPDAYFRCLSMHFESQIAKGSIKRMDEQCPWSKPFILESMKGRPDSEEFRALVSSSIKESGLNLLCDLTKVQEILRPNFEIDDS